NDPTRGPARCGNRDPDRTHSRHGSWGRRSGPLDAGRRRQTRTQPPHRRHLSLFSLGSKVHASRVSYIRSGLSISRLGSGKTHGFRDNLFPDPPRGPAQPRGYRDSGTVAAKIYWVRFLAIKSGVDMAQQVTDSPKLLDINVSSKESEDKSAFNSK